MSEHPQLTPDEDSQQRGEPTPGSFGHTEPPKPRDYPTDWKPDGGLGDAARELIGQVGKERRPRREDVYPYLLIRAYSPGDRGARPPLWPSTPCWESPDLLLIDASYAGPFHPAQLVASPTAGRSYRVFVRVWNLGLLPAIGVHVRAWYVNPGFFGGDPSNPAYTPIEIGGAMVNLEDRTRPGAMAIVELDRTWDIPANLTGHECLMASASCPLDPWSGALDANHDRHVGQRNLTILAPTGNAKKLLHTLGGLLGRDGTLELVHGGLAVTPLLAGVAGRAKDEWGTVAAARAVPITALRRGVAVGEQQHLATVLRTERGVLIADSERVWTMALETGVLDKLAGQQGELDRDLRDADVHPFARSLGTRRVIEALGPDRFDALGPLIDAEPADALLEGLARLWDVEDFSGRGIAGALTEADGANLLRFVHTELVTGKDEPTGAEVTRVVVGGYTVIVVG